MSHARPYAPPPTDAAPARPGWFYYGWVIVPLAALAMAATLPGRTHGLGLITERLLRDLQLSRTFYADMNVYATLLGAAFCLPCGWMIDRFGVRSVLTFALAALGAVVIWLSQVEHWLTLLAAVTLTRGFGQSMLSVVSITMVGKWFNRRLGPAMGVYSVLMSLMMAAATYALGDSIKLFDDWRAPTMWEGIILVGLAPLVCLLTRSAPRDPRCEFGGDPTGEQSSEPTGGGVVAGATLAQALATPCFWVFALSISFFGLISAGLTLFNRFVLQERGFSESTFVHVLVIGLLTGMAANLAAGWLLRFVPLQRLLCVGLLILCAALAGFPFVQTLPQVYAYAVANGVAGGILTVLFFAVWGRAFGKAQLGKIQAAAQMLTVFASAAGPWIIEHSRSYTGSYLAVFSCSAAIVGAFAVAAWFTPVPDAKLAWRRAPTETMEDIVPVLENAG